jgi:hypothetical protein
MINLQTFSYYTNMSMKILVCSFLLICDIISSNKFLKGKSLATGASVQCQASMSNVGDTMCSLLTLVRSDIGCFCFVTNLAECNPTFYQSVSNLFSTACSHPLLGFIWEIL